MPVWILAAVMVNIRITAEPWCRVMTSADKHVSLVTASHPCVWLSREASSFSLLNVLISHLSD